MNPSAAAVLACLLLCWAQAQPASRSSRCMCVNGFVGRIQLQLVKTEPVIYEPTTFCPNTEIIVVIANKQKCVNPQSRAGKLILKNKQRQVNEGTTRTTAASTQANGRSSTNQQRRTTART